MIYCIYQISRTPVAPENYIAFCSIPESFFATNAEYLVEETNRTCLLYTSPSPRDS